MDDNDLARELAAFERAHAGWIEQAQEGRWAVIRGDEIVGLFASLEAGYERGVRQFGTEPFLVKQVLRIEPVETIQRVIWGCSPR